MKDVDKKRVYEVYEQIAALSGVKAGIDLTRLAGDSPGAASAAAEVLGDGAIGLLMATAALQALLGPGLCQLAAVVAVQAMTEYLRDSAARAAPAPTAAAPEPHVCSYPSAE